MTKSQANAVSQKDQLQVSLIPSAAFGNAEVEQTKKIQSPIDEGLKGNLENVISYIDIVDKELEKRNIEHNHDEEVEWCSVSPGDIGRILEQHRNDDNAIEVSPLRFTILAEDDGEKSEYTSTQEDMADKEESEIETQEVLPQISEVKAGEVGVRPFLPCASKSTHKAASKSSFQVSK